MAEISWGFALERIFVGLRKVYGRAGVEWTDAFVHGATIVSEHRASRVISTVVEESSSRTGVLEHASTSSTTAHAGDALISEDTSSRTLVLVLVLVHA